MVRRRRNYAQCPQYELRAPIVAGWSIGLAGAASALVALAYLMGGGRAVTRWVPDEIIATAVRPAPAAALATAALVVGAACFRQLWLEWLAWRPGQIEVDLVAASPSVGTADRERLTMGFRRRLATLRLQAPAPIPGSAPEGDFLEVLSHGGGDAPGILAAIVSLMRAAKPSHAWQVSGALIERPAAPCCGVTIQVVRLPGLAHPPVTVWASSWDEACRQAADRATATILTRTRLCRAPWAAWRRFVMPGELLEAYEQAVRFEEGRRYDEALDAYFRALNLDPSNMVIRLHIGQLQEKLALPLDAIATYEAMLESDPCRIRCRARDLWRMRRAARSERRHALLIARYRRVVLLGGNALAEQWRATADTPRWTARDARRRELRERLALQLRPELERVDDQRRVRSLALDDLLGEPSPGVSGDDAEERRLRLELRELLALAALDDLDGLLRSTIRSTVDLSAASVRLTRVCIDIRLRWIRSELGHGSWPPTPEEIERDVRVAAGRGLRSRWHEHYNAASAYALPLRVESGRRDELAGRAIHHLKSATAQAASAFIVSRRDWLLSEDPDLDGLRAEPAFKTFEAVFFPGEVPTPLRPRSVNRVETARYIRRLLVDTAQRWQAGWHGRGRALTPLPPVHTMLAWWHDECRAWELVRAVAVDFRHWRARLELLQAMEIWSAKYDLDPLEVAFGRYEDDPLPTEVEVANGRMNGRLVAIRRTRVAHASAGAILLPEKCRGEEAAAEAVRRLLALARILEAAEPQRTGGSMLELLDRWQSTLQQLNADGREPDRIALARLCDYHAALWQRLAEWLATDFFDDDSRSVAAFEAELAATSRLWRRAYPRWRERQNGHRTAAPA